MKSIPTTLRNRRTLVFCLLYIGYCISYIDRSAISFAIVHIGKELHFGAAEFGIVASVFYLGYSLMQVPGGWLSDRWGSKRVVIAGIAFWSLFTALTGIAWSLASLIAIRFIFGLCEGSYSSASIKAVAENYDRSERPKMAPLLLSSNYVGSFIAPLVIAPLILMLGWRAAFVVSGTVGIAFSMFYYLVGRKDSKEARMKETASKQSNPGDMFRVFKDPAMWMLLITWFGMSMVNKGLDAWMPVYLMTERHLDLKAVGLLAPLPFIAASIATASGGWILTRYFNGREKYMMASCCAVAGFFIYQMSTAQTIGGVIVYQSVAYFFKSFVFAGVYVLPMKFLPQRIVGTGAGMINFGGQSAGFVAPAAIGFLVSAYGSYSAAFGMLVAATVLATLASLAIPMARRTEVEVNVIREAS